MPSNASIWCTGEDSNLRSSEERQIYSLLPLTTRSPVRCTEPASRAPKATTRGLLQELRTLRPRITLALKRRSLHASPGSFIQGLRSVPRFALALCSRYSGTHSALTGFAGSQTGAFLHWTKAIKGRANILPHKSSNSDVGGSLRGFAFR